MEHAQFGNTEKNIPKLKETWAKHIQHEADDSTDLEKEFEVSHAIYLERV